MVYYLQAFPLSTDNRKPLQAAQNRGLDFIIQLVSKLTRRVSKR